MPNYLLESVLPSATPQSLPIPGREAVMRQNNAQGFSFAIDPFTQLERWLILGSQGGSYYVKEQPLTAENAKCVLTCAKVDYRHTIQIITDISVKGRAPKNDPAIFALALIASQTKDSSFDHARAAAFDAVPDVCRIGTHLFQFINYCNSLRGWGRAMRTVIKRYYTEKRERLAYDLVKYQSREGWSHRDLLRLSHLNIPELNDIFKWIVKGTTDSTSLAGTIIEGFERAKKATDGKELAGLIRQYGLTREMVRTEHLDDIRVWEALLEKMPLTALLRNLNKMTAVGLLTPNGDATISVMKRLSDAEQLRRVRVHPLQVLTAALTYASGHGVKGSLTWTPIKQIDTALEQGFYASFGAVEPSGKRFLLGLDVSGSMGGGQVAGIPGLSPRIAAACMAMVTARTEPVCLVNGFTHVFQDLNIGANDSLQDVLRKTSNLPFGGTDCTLPMQWATQNRVPVDVFSIYTDNETWAGGMHPSVALEIYRQKMGINAAFACVGMVSNGFSIADPNDPKSLDVVGFDTNVPTVLRWLATS